MRYESKTGDGALRTGLHIDKTVNLVHRESLEVAPIESSPFFNTRIGRHPARGPTVKQAPSGSQHQNPAAHYTKYTLPSREVVDTACAAPFGRRSGHETGSDVTCGTHDTATP